MRSVGSKRKQRRPSWEAWSVGLGAAVPGWKFPGAGGSGGKRGVLSLVPAFHADFRQEHRARHDETHSALVVCWLVAHGGCCPGLLRLLEVQEGERSSEGRRSGVSSFGSLSGTSLLGLVAICF